MQFTNLELLRSEAKTSETRANAGLSPFLTRKTAEFRIIAADDENTVNATAPPALAMG